MQLIQSQCSQEILTKNYREYIESLSQLEESIKNSLRLKKIVDAKRKKVVAQHKLAKSLNPTLPDFLVVRL